MREKTKRKLWAGLGLLLAFALWTWLILRVDVRPMGQRGTGVGFAAFNLWFHRLIGVHMGLYTLTDWLGLVPVCVCLGFAGLGLGQLIRRRSLFRVDRDLFLLGVHYLLVFFAYLFFEAVPINYRPIPIDGLMEASYPSSTTLLVLGVMPTLADQIRRRARAPWLRRLTAVFVPLFSGGMVLGRLTAGVHWATDILGSVLLSAGLYLLYRSFCEREACRNGIS